MKYLNEKEIFDLLASQGLAYENNTSCKSMLYRNYISYLSERDISCEDFILKNGALKATHKEMAIELSKVLDNKIVLGSEEFWTLFCYAKCGYEVDWKDEQKHKKDWEHRVIFDTQKKLICSLFKGKNLELFAGFLNDCPNPREELIRSWLSMASADKSLKLTIKPYSFIHNYGNTLKPSELLRRANMYALFDHPEAIYHIKNLYKIYEGKAIGLEFEKILKQKDPSFTPNEPILFEENRSIIYKNCINIEHLSLVKKYKLYPEVESNLFKIIEYTLNWKSRELNFKTEINLDEFAKDIVNNVSKHFASFEITAYSQEQLDNVSKWFKDLINNLEGLFENKGKNLLNTKNKNVTGDMEDFAIYLDSIIRYNNLDNKMPDKTYNNTNKKKI